jgi:hypothetical protein
MKKLLSRVWKSLCRDEDVFFEIGLDKKAWMPALGLVLSAGLIGGLRWVLDSEHPPQLVISLFISITIAWFIFAEAIQFAETLWAGGGMNRVELLRLSGFSALPLACLSIPYVGWLGVIWFWILIYTAVRSLYSTKPRHTAVLVGLGSLAAFSAWGLTVVLVNIILVGK